MTIIKGSTLKPDKSILEKKLLQETLEEGEPEAEVHVTVTHLHQKKKRCCFNLFLILLAMLVLAAGVISGIYLYKHLSKRIHKGKTRFSYIEGDKPYFQSEYAGKKDSGMMEPFQHDLSKNFKMHPKHMLPGQKDGGKKQFHFEDLSKHFKMHRKQMTPGQKDGMMKPFHHEDLSKHFKMHMAPVQVEQDVEVDEKHYERIHMPKFNNFRETLVLHDFTRNYSGIVDFQERICYVMRLNRAKITPPKDWMDLIRKFASGYYMPKASVLKSKYRVSEGPITDISRFGIYIEKECKNYATFWLEKKVGDGLIEKRSAEDYKVYGSFNGRHTIIEYDIYN